MRCDQDMEEAWQGPLGATLRAAADASVTLPLETAEKVVRLHPTPPIAFPLQIGVLGEVVRIVVELRDGDPVSELSQTAVAATSGTAVDRVV